MAAAIRLVSEEKKFPFDARIINIADAYDAMNTDRSYRNRLSKEEIRQELEKGRGVQFDSQLVDIVLELMEENYEPQKSNGWRILQFPHWQRKAMRFAAVVYGIYGRN